MRLHPKHKVPHSYLNNMTCFNVHYKRKKEAKSVDKRETDVKNNKKIQQQQVSHLTSNCLFVI